MLRIFFMLKRSFRENGGTETGLIDHAHNRYVVGGRLG
jgi:hypothetical protein